MENEKMPQWRQWLLKALGELAEAKIVQRHHNPVSGNDDFYIQRGRRWLWVSGQLCQIPGTKGGFGTFVDDISVCLIYAPDHIGSYVEVLAATIRAVAQAETGPDPLGTKAKKKAKAIAARLAESQKEGNI
ncbi:MAG: hypothetical protein WCS18_12565 [Sphaerochaetaceae bacterium]